jgi:RNA polymerase sigma-70 factor, ECF subfamily
MAEMIEKALHDRVADGTQSVYAELDRQYRKKLCALIKHKLDIRYQARLDPEDVYQSVLRTFFRHNAQGEFHFEHDGALWKLLQEIARKKVLKAAEYHGAAMRSPDREEYAADDQLAQPELTRRQAELLAHALADVLDDRRRPLEASLFPLLINGYRIEEIVQIVLAELPPKYAKILQWRLEGCTEEQIAEKLGCLRGEVRYKLRRIVERLARLLAERPEP